MYLKLLNMEQKELCIELAINLASIDGNFSQEERIMIDEYCYEMGITFDYNKQIAESQEIVDRLDAISDEKVKKIIVFEAVGLAMTDNDFCDNEKTLISNMALQFGLDENYVGKCEEVIGEYIEFQNRINSFVLE